MSLAVWHWHVVIPIVPTRSVTARCMLRSAFSSIFARSRTFVSTSRFISRYQMSSDTAATTTPSTSSARRIRVYTKTGDKGTTSLYTGERRPKTDPIFDALGDVDELNSHIGVAREYVSCAQKPELAPLVDYLNVIQSRLLDIGSHIATPLSSHVASAQKLERAAFDEKHIVQLESWIDLMDDQCPPLKNFILPGGGLAASTLHVCRTVCRRSERKTVALSEEGHMHASASVYMNRLSDFFFVAARFAALKSGNAEVIYQKA
jgi:ATP:cob(I)alamin adenosyltransferase